MSHVVDHLAQLPSLAARTAPAPRTRQTTTAGGIDPARYTKPEFGPRLPPGLDLAAIDRSIEREHSLDQLAKLAKLSQRLRVVGEECDPETWRTFPDRDETATWGGEVRWLLATLWWWSADARCSEWITTEVEQIRATLIERIERAGGWKTCALCDGEITTYATEVLDVAECQQCDRVISMREREALTTAEAARRLGISEAAVRKQVERGTLRKVGRRGKENLVTPDGLLQRTPPK